MRNSAAIAAAAMLLFACGLSAHAQEKISDGVVKLGLIEDMSSIYADITGLGAVTAAKMAAEVSAAKSSISRSKSFPPITRIRPTSPRPRRGNGSIQGMSTR